MCTSMQGMLKKVMRNVQEKVCSNDIIWKTVNATPKLDIGRNIKIVTD